MTVHRVCPWCLRSLKKREAHMCPGRKRKHLPRCKLVGEDGNVFNVIGRVMKTLKDAALEEEAEKFKKEALSSRAYHDVLALAMTYVEVY
jgi:hypothetical protein